MELQARLYETPESNVCVAFLTNTNRKEDGRVSFRGEEYYLPRRSISILPDCKTVVFNSQRVKYNFHPFFVERREDVAVVVTRARLPQVNAQHNARTFDVAKESSVKNQWQMLSDLIPTLRHASVISKGPLELMNLTKDTTDYLWYTTR